ncbi:MAG TPA: hypothetical protein VIV60_30415, partial [Polyangiaceae bacterium]
NRFKPGRLKSSRTGCAVRPKLQQRIFHSIELERVLISGFEAESRPFRTTACAVQTAIGQNQPNFAAVEAWGRL